MFRIKNLYEIPKNLPGEDSTFPSVKLVKSENSSTSSYISHRYKNNESKISYSSKEEQQVLANENNSNNNSISSILESIKEEFPQKEKKKIRKVNINDKEIETNNKIHNMLLDILNEEEDKVKSPEIGSNNEPKKAEIIFQKKKIHMLMIEKYIEKRNFRTEIIPMQVKRKNLQMIQMKKKTRLVQKNEIGRAHV